MRKYRQITTELTFRCNARCPACHRQKPLRVNLNDPKYTYTLESFKKVFTTDFLNNLEWLVLNGNFGDSVMNKEFRSILSYVKEHDTKINIHTNGGIHNKDYWTDVGNILTKNDIINFALDGLSDTHHLYRINTAFGDVFNNAKAVINTNRPQVHWKYIVFDYNEHQIEEARNLAVKERFTSFSLVKTGRSFAPPKEGAYVHAKKTIDLDSILIRTLLFVRLNSSTIFPFTLINQGI
jgi:MoaA/NifB/PqqE/SkfB family radical SAM enzyme